MTFEGGLASAVGRIVWRRRHRYKAQMIISDSDALVRVCRELEEGACVGVDTEFHRERTYLATAQPRDAEALASVHGVSAKLAAGRRSAAALEAIRRGFEVGEDECPELSARSRLGGRGALLEALRSLLRERCETLRIPARLVATRDELERIATDEAPAVRALSGWRAEVFGDEALALTCAASIDRAPVRNAGGSRAAG